MNPFSINYELPHAANGPCNAIVPLLPFEASVAKLDAAWREERSPVYIEHGGAPSEEVDEVSHFEKLKYARRRVRPGAKLPMIILDLRWGRVAFHTDVHLFAALRDAGFEKITVAIHPQQMDDARRLLAA